MDGKRSRRDDCRFDGPESLRSAHLEFDHGRNQEVFNRNLCPWSPTWCDKSLTGGADDQQMACAVPGLQRLRIHVPSCEDSAEDPRAGLASLQLKCHLMKSHWFVTTWAGTCCPESARAAAPDSSRPWCHPFPTGLKPNVQFSGQADGWCW